MLAGVIVVIAKPLIGRQDALVAGPHAADDLWLVRRWGHFPSGHAAVAFSLAGSIAKRFRPLAPVLYGLAALVALSRVYEGAHLLSDVYAGALVGLLAVWLLDRWRREPAGADARPARPLSHGARAVAAIVLLWLPLVLLHLGAGASSIPTRGATRRSRPRCWRGTTWSRPLSTTRTTSRSRR